MKYAIILPDGAADEPLPQLGGRTPLDAANIPNMDWIAQHGRLGRSVTVPDGFVAGTDVATLTVFGYDPHVCYPGRAPIEAAAKGLTAGPDELIFRCNFVTVLDGCMRDFTAGHITQPEGDQLIVELNRLARDGEPALRGCVFHAGVGYRNLMIAAGAADMQLKCKAPHDIPNQPVGPYLPQGHGQERVRAIMDRAAGLFRDHPVNRARRAAQHDPVTGIWLWGQGRPVTLEPLERRFGVRGAVITAVDIIRGLAVMMGMELIDVPGVTGYIDTNYAGKGEYAARALDDYDLMVVHVEAPDEASHQGDAAMKVAALEKTDKLVVGPVLEALRKRPEWRILVAPDHYTCVASTQHAATPPPFCMAGTGIDTVERQPFCERAASSSQLLFDPGCGLIESFMQGMEE